MEVEEIQRQACKFPRIGNGRLDSSKLAQKERYPDEEEDREQHQLKRAAAAAASTTTVGVLGGGGDTGGGGANRLRGWHHSSRIIRVSRASGGKDRHSKVWTSKGLRDRRVRLSVTTAIQFYDLQDRLGYDQPSKAVEWLIKAAAESIAELPSLNSPFPDTPKQLSDEKRGSEEGTDQQGFDSVELDGDTYQQNQSQHRSLTKSACSSTSETSKGSGLSLSRSEQRENRVKARERARVRAKEKEKDNDSSRIPHHHHSVNHISQSSSFTELLTGGIGSVNNNSNSNSNSNNNATTSPTGSSPHQNPNGEPSFFHKARWSATPMDYFNTGLPGPSSSRPPHHFAGQIQLGSSNTLPPQTMSIPSFSVSNENHHQHQHQHQQEMQHFSFDHLIPVTTTTQPGAGGDYNLNFTISSGLAGFNRGTLQSNSSSPSLLPHLQRFGSSPIDGSSNVPFFVGAAAGAAAPPVDHHHHHQFSAGFDGRLQLYYGDGSRHSDQKGKAKN